MRMLKTGILSELVFFYLQFELQNREGGRTSLYDACYFVLVHYSSVTPSLGWEDIR